MELATVKEEKSPIDEERHERLAYLDWMIYRFAETYKMNKPRAYRYLKQYGGIDYILEHWWALHTDNQIYSVRSVFKECERNGGAR